MQMLTRGIRKGKAALAALLLMLVPVCNAMATGQGAGLSLEPELYWDSGDYGGDTTIHTYSFSLIGEFAFADRWTLSLTLVPYIHQDESYTDVVLVAGQPVHHQDIIGTNPHKPAETMPGNSVMRGHHRNPIDPAVEIADSTVQEVERHGSASGIGDTTFSLSYRFVDESDSLPEMSVHGDVKLPTADEDKGLGTGETDYCLGIELIKEIGAWTVDVGMDYNILGDPDGYDLDNYVAAYGDLSTGLGPGLTTIFKLYGAQAPSEESDAELTVGLECDYAIEHLGSVYAGVDAGLSDGSPDFSLSVGYSMSF